MIQHIRYTCSELQRTEYCIFVLGIIIATETLVNLGCLGLNHSINCGQRTNQMELKFSYLFRNMAVFTHYLAASVPQFSWLIVPSFSLQLVLMEMPHGGCLKSKKYYWDPFFNEIMTIKQSSFPSTFIWKQNCSSCYKHYHVFKFREQSFWEPSAPDVWCWQHLGIFFSLKKSTYSV